MSDSPEKKKIDFKSMAKRLFSTVLLWGIVAAVFYSGKTALIVVLTAILAVLGAIEYLRITKGQPGKQRRVGAFIVSVLYLIWLAYDLVAINLADVESGERTQRLLSFTPEVVGMIGVLFLSFFMSLRRKIEGMDSVNAVALCILGYCYVPVLFGGFMMRMVYLPPSPEVSGVWLVLFVAVVTKFTDMGAYLSGTLFGRNKMVKHISPGKTWEGTLGSFFVAQLGAFGVCYFAGDKLGLIGEWWSIALLSVLISVAAIVGDLAESILKRSVKVKDSGDTLPGIGGVLDLIDSLCFSAPVAYLYLILVQAFA